MNNIKTCKRSQQYIDTHDCNKLITFYYQSSRKYLKVIIIASENGKLYRKTERERERERERMFGKSGRVGIIIIIFIKLSLEIFSFARTP